jgi:hypothetical protein
LREGKSRDGRKFKVPVAPANYFSRMTETDLNALVAYIRTLPPLEPKSNNYTWLRECCSGVSSRPYAADKLA